ncbi:MAG: glycoside hydrolase family 5 protein [Treponema sp.]|jgi:endoglucanase|nr:glycoside hydrolase family 5 protein [Treponema sp.]
MKNRYKLFIIAVFSAICFLSANCGSSGAKSGPVNIDNFTTGGEYYQSARAPSAPAPFRNITAAQLVSEIKIGWNLGNTLDTHDDGQGWMSGVNIQRMETSWGNPVTTQANIDTIKAAGFNAIRIPVSWAKASNNTLNIREDWMDRVTEVVNYAVNNDMYIILNTHHDESIFKFTSSQRDKSLTAFHKIWSQIAYNFRNYNEKLIFEALNEPRTKGSEAEWSGGTSSEHLILNEYYQLFVNIVRASGGNNDKRKIMVTTYAASAEQTAMNALVIPKDTIENKIIISIHSYSPYNFALNQGSRAVDRWSRDNSNDTSAINAVFDRADNIFIKKGYPVIMGEFGAVHRNNEPARAAWAEYYVSYAKSKGVPCFLWDNGGIEGRGELFGFINRRNNTFPFPDYLAGLMRGTR